MVDQKLKEDFLKIKDPVKLLEIMKKLTQKEMDSEMYQHFNVMVKKQALEFYGKSDPDVIYENTEFLRKSLREKH